MLDALRRWFRMPARPPQPEVTPEEDAVVRDDQGGADEWRADDPPRGDSETQ